MIATSTFIPLRLVGGLFAVGLLVSAAYRYRRRAISRLNLILTGAVTAAILALAIFPRLFRPLFTTFNFQPGNQQIGRASCRERV